MRIAMQRMLSTPCPTAISVLGSALAAGALAFGSFSTAAATLETDCGFAVDTPPGASLARQADAEPPFCLYTQSDGEATPFANSVLSLPWARLGEATVNGQPLRDVNFFRLAEDGSFSHIGRSSYADPRNGYAQAVVGKPVLQRRAVEGLRRVAVTTELRVTWLKPLAAGGQEEATERYLCVDSAVGDRRRVAVLNWCLPKRASTARELAEVARSLRLTSGP